MTPVVLDIHGVCCDFVGGYLLYTESRFDYKNWPKGTYDLTKVLSGPKINTLPVEFWETLPRTAEFYAIVSAIRNRGLSYILCSRTTSREQMIGTFAWAQRHFSGVPYMAAESSKAMNFAKGMFLIDDSDEEINTWQGPKFLVPRPWNTGTGDLVTLLNCALDEHCARTYTS